MDIVYCWEKLRAFEPRATRGYWLLGLHQHMQSQQPVAKI